MHGNGPQVGLLALESAADPALTHPYPLDELVAETQGLIGYWLQQALGRHLDDPGGHHGHPDGRRRRRPGVRRPDQVRRVGVRRAGGEGAGRAGTTGRSSATERAGGASSPHPLPAGSSRSAPRTTCCAAASRSCSPAVAASRSSRWSTGSRVSRPSSTRTSQPRSRAKELGADLFLVLTDVTAVMTDFGTADQRALGEVSASDLESARLPGRLHGTQGGGGAASSCDEPARVPRSVPSTTRWPSAPARQEPRSGPARRHDAAKMRSALGTPRPETPKLSSRRPRLSSTVTVIDTRRSRSCRRHSPFRRAGTDGPGRRS